MKKIDKKIEYRWHKLRTSNAEAMQTIPPFWRSFIKKTFCKNRNKVSDDVYAVYTNLENEGKNNGGVYS